MKIAFCFIVSMTLLLNKVNAQEQFVQPTAKLITSFPFVQLTGGIVILKGLIDDDEDSLNFVLDTGSGGISFDSSTVDEHNWIRAKSNRTVRGIAGMRTVDFTYKHTLSLPGLKVDNLDFHINDYNLLTSVYGIKIDGIIGYSFLRKFIVRIDYDSQKIQVFTPGLYKYPRGGYVIHPGFNGLPFHSITVKDEKPVLGKFIFDTGAGLCFLLSQDFVDDSMFISKKRKILPTQAEGLGGKKLMNITVLKDITLGPYHFKKVPVYIFNDEFNVTSYPFLGGLIGNDLLRRFNAIINYPEQIIYLKPNHHYIDPFDYSYTGLGIYMEEGEIKVIDIIPNSPGDKAGFRTDDIIYAVDKNFTRNIQTIKAALQNAGAKVTVLVMRNGKPIVLNLKIKNLLR
jgi:hypothetical protein